MHVTTHVLEDADCCVIVDEMQSLAVRRLGYVIVTSIITEVGRPIATQARRTVCT